jgi:tetratricopeptide (TPR) repeat protein
MQAGLAFAEAGRLAEAENSLRLARKKDPALHRAAYNLGLLLAQQEKLAGAVEALRAAEQAGPEVADYPAALATVLLRMGDRAGARAAAERALALDPAHPGAQQVRAVLR